jgi:hypothetical protein
MNFQLKRLYYELKIDFYEILGRELIFHDTQNIYLWWINAI